jgi:hypothetical protein
VAIQGLILDCGRVVQDEKREGGVEIMNNSNSSQYLSVRLLELHTVDDFI